MSYKELLSKELEFNYEISFEEAFKRFPGITRENFDLIKYEYRRDVLGIKPKTKKNLNKNSNNYTIKNVKSNIHEQPNKIEKLTIDNTEKLILDMLNNKSSIPESQIRIAVDFMVKLKGDSGPEDGLRIDAKYLKLVESEEGIDHQPGDMVEVEFNMEEFRKAGLEAGEQDNITDKSRE